MERLDLPIEKLSLAQKLDLMEAIWDNLTKDERERLNHLIGMVPSSEIER